MKNKKIDVSELLEEMGPALTSSEVEIRLKGTKFLTGILKSLNLDLLNDSQLKFITQFYIDRMKDHHSIAPHVITGLLAITKMKNFPSSLSVQILQQLFQQIPCQSQVIMIFFLPMINSGVIQSFCIINRFAKIA